MKKLKYTVILILIQSAYSQLREFGFYVDTEKSRTILHLVSVEMLPCVGYGIHTWQLRNSDTVIVHIRGFRRPEPCYPDMDVATERIPLSGIRMKTFVIKFRWKKDEDVWNVKDQGAAFVAKPLRATFTSYLK